MNIMFALANLILADRPCLAAWLSFALQAVLGERPAFFVGQTLFSVPENCIVRCCPYFSLSYETRPNSKSYLENINEDLADTNIDYLHIYNAYRCIDDWFKRQPDDVVAADDLYGCLVKYVSVIWYEVGSSEDSIELFTRLNIGKIPLMVDWE